MTRRPLGRALWVTGAAALAGACALALVLETGAGAAVTPGIKPDIVLSPKNPRYASDVESILVNDLTPQADPAAVPTPDMCREPALDLYCDVYRVRINRDRTPGASNFVQMLMSWDKQGSTPDLALVAAGLGASDFPDLELFLYKDADTYIDYALVGGRSAVTPERMVWEATQDEYDIVVRSGLGVGTGYSLRALYSNEMFDPPFELLEESTSAGRPPGAVDDRSAAPPDGSSGGSGATPAPQLALAPVEVDGQIAGIGLGATEQFDPQSLGLGGATRAVAATSPPPSAFVLILGMIAFPLAVASLAIIILRRRRDAFTA